MANMLHKANHELNQDLMGDDLFVTDEEVRVRRCPRCQSENIQVSRKQSGFERFIATLGGEVLRCHVCFRRSAWFGMNHMKVSNGSQQGPFRPRRAGAPSAKPAAPAAKPMAPAAKPTALDTAARSAVTCNIQTAMQAAVQPKLQGSASTRSALQRLQEASITHLHSTKSHNTPPNIAKENIAKESNGKESNTQETGIASPPTSPAKAAAKHKFFSVPTNRPLSNPMNSALTKAINKPAFTVPVSAETGALDVTEVVPAIVQSIPHQEKGGSASAASLTLPQKNGTQVTIHLPKRLVERRKIGFRIGELPKWPGQVPSQSGSGQLARRPQ